MDHIISKQTVLLLNYPWHLYKNLYYWTTWRCRDTTRNFKNLYYWTTWRCKDSELPDTCTNNSLVDALIGLAMEVPDVPDLASHLGYWLLELLVPPWELIASFFTEPSPAFVDSLLSPYKNFPKNCDQYSVASWMCKQYMRLLTCSQQQH